MTEKRNETNNNNKKLIVMPEIKMDEMGKEEDGVIWSWLRRQPT